MRTGFLLINLGTPEGTRPSDLRRYLREFLGDPRVLDLPPLGRWALLNLVILPFRPRRSAEAYRKIWTERGSPLLYHGQDLRDRVAERLGDEVVVELAMRYGRPSLATGLGRLAAKGVSRIVALPLFPQYSAATTGSALEALYREAGRRWVSPPLEVLPAFYDHPAFIDALAARALPIIEEKQPEKVLFSFHGLPERQLVRADPSGARCLRSDDCCERIDEGNAFCYRAHCLATARALGEALGLPEEQRVVCFQSRLGRTPWMRPYTEEVLAELPKQGVRRAVILSPAFVADCLETLEELGIRGRETWRAAGGESLDLVPGLNASSAWVDAVVTLFREGRSE